MLLLLLMMLLKLMVQIVAWVLNVGCLVVQVVQDWMRPVRQDGRKGWGPETKIVIQMVGAHFDS